MEIEDFHIQEARVWLADSGLLRSREVINEQPEEKFLK
jgi:hypothetical protein